MILDASRLPHGAVLQTEICIIGGGPAGIVLSRELGGRGHEVLLLEAGGLRYHRSSEDHLRGSVAAGSVHAAPHMYRRRMLGGATRIWGGRCVPLDPLDLEQRPWVPESGWPIVWEQLKAFYPRAQHYLEAGSYAYGVTEALGRTAPATIAGFEHPDIGTDRLERFSPPTDLGRTQRTWLSASNRVRVLLNATAMRFETASGPVTALRAASAPGRDIVVQARRYVLAAGGIECARLLMLSDGTRRGGLGNEGGRLGRHYMCHIEATLGVLALEPAARPIALHFERSPDGIYVRRKLVVSEAAQRRERLLNTTFRLHYPLIADPAHGSGILSAMYLVKDTILPEYRRKLATIEIANRDRLRRDARFWGAHVRNVVADTPRVARFGLDWTRRRIFAKRKLPFIVIENRAGRYQLDVNAEQIPNPESRITLSTERDRFGSPRPHVDWRVTAQDRDSLGRSMLLLARAVEQAGVGRLQVQAELDDEIARAAPVGGHHIGTARMSALPNEGVVDPDCTVHGVPNLHVVSAAVFPTCGHANPTLTILALTLRLADHLHATLSSSPTPTL